MSVTSTTSRTSTRCWCDLTPLGDVSVERNRGIVALVGAGISDAGDAMARRSTALGDVKVHMVSLSATGINLTLVVDGDAGPRRQCGGCIAAFFPTRRHERRSALAIIGDGKMGRAIADLARERGLRSPRDARRGGQPRCARGHATRARRCRRRHRVHRAGGRAGEHHRRVRTRGVRSSSGTTGWGERLDEVSSAVMRVERRARCWAPNFSVGVNLFLAMAAAAAGSCGARPSFDAHMVETHHAAKKDAPSGTAHRAGSAPAARTLGAVVPIDERAHGPCARARTSSSFDAPFEQIRLTHEARDRRVFADGALRAARGCAGRRRRLHHARRARPRDRRSADAKDALTGCGTALVTPFTPDGDGRRGSAARARRLADRRGHPLPRAVRLDRRGGDDDARRAAPRRRDHRRGGGGPRPGRRRRRLERHARAPSRCRVR